MVEGQQESGKGRELNTSSDEKQRDDTRLSPETLLRKQIQKLPSISPDVCISRVPQTLRSINKNGYTPKMVSLGPLHHGKKELQAMEEHKLRYLQKFLERSNSILEDWLEKLKGWEEHIRNFYAEKIDIPSDKFVTMILLDSCLIIEILIRFKKNNPKEHADYLSRRNMIYGLKTDMILLENQLPFFVLHDLYKLAFPDEEPLEFLWLSMEYFTPMMIHKDQYNMLDKMVRHLKSGFVIKHFVDMLRICHLPSFLRLPSNKKSMLKAAPSLTDLLEAGVKLERSSSNCLLDIRYSTGVLRIPHMVINDNSEYVLRNIIAFEDCHHPYDSYMIDYIFFMDMLINTNKDVDLLVQKGILENWWGDSSAVATLFNRLGMENAVWASNYYFYDMSEKLNAYCDIRWNRWRAALKRDYCRTPWLLASTVAAVILLLLTFTQTICAIIFR